MYYIYAYLRKSDHTPYYIGKGVGNRAWNRSNHKSHGIFAPTDDNLIIIMENNLSEIGALALERRYIRWYGRENNGSGILKNKTDGGEGSTGMFLTSEKRKEMGKASGKSRLGKKRGSIPSISDIKSKKWIVTKPNGEQINVINLFKFCAENDLSSSHMSNVAKGKRQQHKGYKVERYYESASKY